MTCSKSNSEVYSQAVRLQSQMEAFHADSSDLTFIFGRDSEKIAAMHPVVRERYAFLCGVISHMHSLCDTDMVLQRHVCGSPF